MIFTNRVRDELRALVGRSGAAPFVVTDRNVAQIVIPRLDLDCRSVVIEPGDINKTLDTARTIWTAMEEARLTRHSLVLNIGGGVVSDIGGFCAATFKRGVRFCNVPTTLLCAVDAALGGKTGVNFNGLKNEIGCFAPADDIVVSACFFATLPRVEILSGWGEMLKHSLLDSVASTAEMFAADPFGVGADEMLGLLQSSIAVKERIVALDPREAGVRKVLNLGHTAGHAIEALRMAGGKPVAHGFAVAWGLVVAAVLSKMVRGLESRWLQLVASRVRELYGSPSLTCEDYDELLAIMHRDKKNRDAGAVAFTLLDAPGRPVYDQVVADSEIRAALDISRDFLD